MAVFSYTDAFLHCAGYDFTVDTNTIQATMDAATLDATTFNSGGWQETAGGLITSTLNYSGFWQAASSGDQAPDNQAFPMLQTSQVYTFGPVEAENERCFMVQGMKSQYALGGAVGELMPFSLAANGTDGDGVVRGRLAKSKGTVSATGALGTGLNIGAAGSSAFSYYAAFHIFTAGTTITVQVQSDDNSGFTSPTTIATLGPLTTSGGTWMTPIPGPITDDWFRFNVSAITGTFTVAGAIGRGPY